MNRMNKYFLVGLMAMLTALPLSAQVLEAQSNPVNLDFGYPELRFKSDEIGFLDENDNGIIDPGEGAIIRLSIENTSRYVAKDVIITPQDLNNIQGLEVPKLIEIGDILGGEEAFIQVGVAASREVETGTANFIFYAQERREKGRVSVVYTVATVVDPNQE
jgi:hypothetical protein